MYRLGVGLWKLWDSSNHIFWFLQKGGTKGELIKDWRPITLLSQIYKLISGVVAKRIKKHLGKLISGCQKAYQDTSNIGEIILNVLEIIAISKYHKKPGMILLIDFSKAFDSISHEYIYECLNFFNVGPPFPRLLFDTMADLITFPPQLYYAIYELLLINICISIILSDQMDAKIFNVLCKLYG